MREYIEAHLEEILEFAFFHDLVPKAQLKGNEAFNQWAVIFARAAIKHQDKTFRQMVHEKIIPSYAEYFLNLPDWKEKE